MNIDDIKKLAEILQQYKLSSMEITEGETKIILKGQREETTRLIPEEGQRDKRGNVPVIKESGIDFNDIREIKSPMVGIFYSSPAPGASPFITVGSKIKKGDVLCIIEAMKLMNELTAETDGEIVDICVSNGEVVEYGQTIFKIC